jgi:hypothetical protein
MTKRKKAPPAAGKKEGAPFGSRNAAKLKTAEDRQAAYMAYCDHIAAGYSDKAFHTPCVARTIDNILKQYPQEFDLDLLVQARAKGCHFWEQMGMAGAMGKLKNFNAGSWVFNMKNRHGWKDRQEIGLDKNTRAVFRMKMGKDLKQNETEEDEE